jgi:hypothetical protein
LKVKDEQIDSLNKQLVYITELMFAKEARDWMRASDAENIINSQDDDINNKSNKSNKSK